MVQSKNVRLATESYVDAKASAGSGTSTDYSSTFVDVYLGDGDGVSTRQTVTNSFTIIQLPNENFDVSNLFNTSTYEYNVPSTGIYLISARVRLVDEQVSSQKNFGIGVHTENSDHVSFTWFVQNASGTDNNRRTYAYQRIGKFNADQKLRLYAYAAGGNQKINNASLTIVRTA